MTKQKRKGKCPLLNRLNYPYHISDGDVGTWYKQLCESCPLIDACVEEWAGKKVPPDIQKKLGTVVIPCPHCKDIDRWWEFQEDGLSCLHCSERIYHTKPLKKTSARLM